MRAVLLGVLLTVLAAACAPLPGGDLANAERPSLGAAVPGRLTSYNAATTDAVMAGNAGAALRRVLPGFSVLGPRGVPVADTDVGVSTLPTGPVGGDGEVVVDPALFPAVGPYRLLGVAPDGSTATLVANDRWWGDPPLVPRIVVHTSPADPAALLAADEVQALDLPAGPASRDALAAAVSPAGALPVAGGLSLPGTLGYDATTAPAQPSDTVDPAAARAAVDAAGLGGAAVRVAYRGPDIGGTALPASGTAGLRTGAPTNWGGYANARVDSLLDQLDTAATLAEQLPITTELQTILWADLPTLPLHQVPTMAAVLDRLPSAVANPSAAGIA